MKLMLAGALELAGSGLEAERLREAARELHSANEMHRGTAAAEARKLAARVLAEIAGPV